MGHDQSLDRVIDALTERFPSPTHDEIADCVNTVHAELRRTATVTEHPAALTQTLARDLLASHSSRNAVQP